MMLRGLKQIDILNLTKNLCEQYNVKFNKSDISQYVSGKTEPNQDKLFILSKALDVDVTWLMGYDVPMERINDQFEQWEEKHNSNGKLVTEVKIEELIRKEYGDDTMTTLDMYRQLDLNDQAEIRGEIKGMLKNEKYSIKKEYKNA